MKLNEIHDHCMHHKSDIHVQLFRTTLSGNCVANVGIKLQKKVSRSKETRKDTGIQKRAEIFLTATQFLLWMNICLSKYYHHMFITVHTFIILASAYFLSKKI